MPVPIPETVGAQAYGPLGRAWEVTRFAP
jgi:hypothetical protein